MVGKKLNEFGMISPRRVEGNDFGDEIAQELGIATSSNTIIPSATSRTKSRFPSSDK